MKINQTSYSHPGRAIYKVDASHAIAKLRFPQTLTTFLQSKKRHLQFNDDQSSFRFSMCSTMLRSIQTPRAKNFFQLVYGDLFETNPWAKHIPDTLARRRYDSQMNIARAIYRGSAANEPWDFLDTRAPAREIRCPAHFCRAESNSSLGHGWHRTSRFATSLSAGYSDAALWQCWTIFASASRFPLADKLASLATRAKIMGVRSSS